MHFRRLICALALTISAVAPLVAANPFNSPIDELTLKDGTVLHHVVVMSFSSRVLMAKWDGGRGTIRIENLPDALQPQARTMGASADTDSAVYTVPAPKPNQVATAPRAANVATAPGNPTAAARKGALLGAGAVAPEFTSKAASGGDVNLSDYRGKVVVLDFWATWCGPCQRSMPHTESVAREYKDYNVVVLAVCTSDTKAAYEKWVPTHQPGLPDMTFTFDPGGKGEDRVSKALYGVQGIPTQFVIGADGVIKAAIVGFYADDARLEAGLSKAGVPLNAADLDKVQQIGKPKAGT